MFTLDDLKAPTPAYEDLAAKYRVLESDLSAAATSDTASEVVPERIPHLHRD